MEDFSIKAIVIGVSLFVTMMTLTAILIYFNTAREVSDIVSSRVDIAETYDRIMSAGMDSGYITGVEVRSLINKYAGKDNVIINIRGDNGIVANNVNSNWIRSNGLISEQKLDLINPVWNCKVDKVQNSENIILEISLNVDNTEED